MKYIYLLIATLTILTSCEQSATNHFLVKNKISDYSIVVSKNSDTLTQRAAQEIQQYIFKVSGAKLTIVATIEPGKKQIILGKAGILDTSISIGLDSIDDDGFIIKTTGDNLLIAGKNGKANLYAAYTFIEEYLGCRLLSASEEFIPESSTIKLPDIDNTYNPAFSFRRTLFPGLYNEKYRYWHKIETLDEWGSFVHTFNKLIAPEKDFDEHPEFFSLNGNNRLKDGQLCLSNPELLNTIKENLSVEIEKHPDKKYWSVSQNDCYNFCECSNCQALYDKYESVSGAYIFMANELAREFPDKHISTLAYQFTRSAPKNIKPLENVNIMFCSIECNRSMPLAEDKRSAGFVKDMQDWSKLTSNIFVWDYVVQFKNYLTPFPNFDVLQPNIQFFKENKVDMMFQQGSNRNWSDLAELKQYLISKLMWNPNANADSIINDFLSKYYGPAAPYIKSYGQEMHSALAQHKTEEWLNIYGYPSDYYDSYLTPALLEKYKALMDKAEAAVQRDSLYLKRVLRTRLAVDFAYLDIALNKNTGNLSYLDKSNETLSLRTDMLEYLDRMVENSKLTNTTRINERNFLTEDYQKYVLHKLSLMTKANLAKGKKVTCLTAPSETYPVGGAAALTDGLFGDLDYHNNWLGFQGNDMQVEIDLQKVENINQLSMNFLQAVNSWVFQPVEVSVEVSMDGNQYRQVKSMKGNTDIRTYLVKAIPFNITFPEVQAQYIRVTATSLKQCPEWHRGFGNPSWIFIDELIVE